MQSMQIHKLHFLKEFQDFSIEKYYDNTKSQMLYDLYSNQQHYKVQPHSLSFFRDKQVLRINLEFSKDDKDEFIYPIYFQYAILKNGETIYKGYVFLGNLSRYFKRSPYTVVLAASFDKKVKFLQEMELFPEFLQKLVQLKNYYICVNRMSPGDFILLNLIIQHNKPKEILNCYVKPIINKGLHEEVTGHAFLQTVQFGAISIRNNVVRIKGLMFKNNKINAVYNIYDQSVLLDQDPSCLIHNYSEYRNSNSQMNINNNIQYNLQININPKNKNQFKIFLKNYFQQTSLFLTVLYYLIEKRDENYFDHITVFNNKTYFKNINAYIDTNLSFFNKYSKQNQ